MAFIKYSTVELEEVKQNDTPSWAKKAQPHHKAIEKLSKLTKDVLDGNELTAEQEEMINKLSKLGE